MVDTFKDFCSQAALIVRKACELNEKLIIIKIKFTNLKKNEIAIYSII